jgi:hypothetical protein
MRVLRPRRIIMTESFSTRYGAASVSTSYPVRQTLAKVLRTASQALARVACELSAVDVRSESAASAAGNVYACPQLEFYAEAGAAEGALFVDGQLVGYVPGVRRL